MLIAEKCNGVLILTLSRPERLNALNKELLKALVDSIRSASSDSSIAYLLLRGAGRTFCAGGDLRDVWEKAFLGSENLPAHLHQLVGHLNIVIELLQDFPAPTLALLHGNIAGGGFALGLAADYRIAAPDLQIRIGPGLLGVIPAGGCTYFLPRLLGDSLAKKILLSDQPIEVWEAFHLGIVSEIVPQKWLQNDSEELINILLSPATIQTAQKH